MEEYVFKRATTAEWQKWLNQWKHNYNLEILKIVDYPTLEGECTIYLKRTPKGE